MYGSPGTIGPIPLKLSRSKQSLLKGEPALKKIEYAVGAAGLFVQHLHREGFDRGLISTFGNNFNVEQGFTGTESYLHRALGRVAGSISNERTRLYDSVEDVIMRFWSTASRERPWLLTVITDGQDNESTKYRNNPAGIGRFVATRYNHEDSNFIFVIGVGEGNQIDKNALATMGNYGNFLAMTIAAFPLLEMLFIRIALQVSEQLEGIRVNYGNLSWTEVSRIRQVSRIPFDYAFLIDRSGSMGEPG
jgi:hypothetical protein